MYRRHRWSREDEVDEAAERQTVSLAAVVVVLLLLVGGLYLVEQLRTSASIDDCLLSGRRNCDVGLNHRR